MKERPILFKGAMVRSILDGSKTQTRRVIKHQPVGKVWPLVDTAINFATGEKENVGVWFIDENDLHDDGAMCPYGQPGGRLWVRESGWQRPERTAKMMREGADTWAPYYYDADGNDQQEALDLHTWGFKRRPSIHMPRAASRITLEIIAVRVERLQEISQADARAEGAPPSHPSIDRVSRSFGYADFSRSWYAQLWESINGPGSWDANPWIWVIEFRRVS